MNWSEEIAKRIPEKMGGAKLRKEYLKWEHKHIGQKDVLEELLEEKFGSGISIEGQEDGGVIILRERGSAGETVVFQKKKATVLPSVMKSDVGVDFRVVVPMGVDKEEVEAYVRRYVLAGVGFRVGN